MIPMITVLLIYWWWGRYIFVQIKWGTFLSNSSISLQYHITLEFIL